MKINNVLIGLLVLGAIMLVMNQVLLYQVRSQVGISSGSSSFFLPTFGGQSDLKDVDVNSIESTAQGIAALFPVKDIKNTNDAVNVMIPRGTPSYGAAMGVSYDDPVTALDKLAKAYPALDAQIKEKPELWKRYLNLASEPRGVSCEYCCGIGPTGATKDGQSRCGCQHNPALLAVTQWLLLNTDMSDAEILREVYLWKSLFFPKNMITLATQIAGGDTKVLEDLPGMVGGC